MLTNCATDIRKTPRLFCYNCEVMVQLRVALTEGTVVERVGGVLFVIRLSLFNLVLKVFASDVCIVFH